MSKRSKDAVAPDEVERTTLLKELWDQGWVAENEDEAVAQAERMYDLFRGRRVVVDRLSFKWNDDWDEYLFDEPWPEVWVVELSTESGWDGDVLLAEWGVEIATPDQVAITNEGETIRLGDVEGWVITTPPGIGTAAGFGNTSALVYPASVRSVRRWFVRRWFARRKP